MKSTQHRELSSFALMLATILLLACNSNNKEMKQEATASTADEHSNARSIAKDNEVRDEAPGAHGALQQGYALPQHGNENAQSPINIISSQSKKNNSEPVAFAFHSDITAAENLGHTIQIDFKPGSTCVAYGKEYSSKQFHFHTPSEHLIDGMTFPMEMHIVNVLKDSTKPISYVVIAVLFKMGAENKFIKEFLARVPSEEGNKSELQNGQVKFEDLLSLIPKNELNSYYSYHGSLTTPPYTEAVQWIILKHVVEASEEQIAQIERLEGNNARHVQALNDRRVMEQ